MDVGVGVGGTGGVGVVGTGAGAVGWGGVGTGAVGGVIGSVVVPLSLSKKNHAKKNSKAARMATSAITTHGLDLRFSSGTAVLCCAPGILGSPPATG